MEFFKKYKNIIFIAVLILLGAYVAMLLTYTYITVQFVDLRPMRGNIEVFYKGIKVGKVQNMHHSKDYKYTLVNIMLYPNDLKLPINTIANFKKEKRKDKDIDFIELIYPEKPSEFLLQDGTTIAGETTVDGETYLANLDPDEAEEIKNNLKSASENLNIALASLGELFGTLDGIAQSNQASLQEASKNLARSTGNINQMTSKLNESMPQETLNRTILNINTATENLKGASADLPHFDQTMIKVDAALSHACCAAANANEITHGVKQTLKQRLGAFRFLFGKPIQNECGCQKKTPCMKN